MSFSQNRPSFQTLSGKNEGLQVVDPGNGPDVKFERYCTKVKTKKILDFGPIGRSAAISIYTAESVESVGNRASPSSLNTRRTFLLPDIFLIFKKKCIHAAILILAAGRLSKGGSGEWRTREAQRRMKMESRSLYTLSRLDLPSFFVLQQNCVRQELFFSTRQPSGPTEQ